MKPLMIAIAFLVAAPLAAQDLRVLPRDQIHISPTPSGGPSLTARPDFQHLICEQNSDSTVICSCNDEPAGPQFTNCIAFLTEHCGPVRNGEAECPIEPQ